MKLPKFSFVVCTYNSPELIKRCLDSILRQKYLGKIEVILTDGGSDRETLALLDAYVKKYSFMKFIKNKKKLPEGEGNGKWLAYKHSKGEFIAIVDQDNELQGDNWINDILIPLNKENIFGCLSMAIVQPNDSLTTQYVGLTGTDPFFAYRSIEGLINLKKIGEEKKDYFLIKLDSDNLLVTGGNCFVYNAKYLKKIGGYIQDTENVSRIVRLGHNKMAVSKTARTHHFATKNFLDFIAKKKRWSGVYDLSKTKDYTFSYLPRNKIEKRNFIINLFTIFTILPNIFISIKKLYQTRQNAWVLHAPLSVITGLIYLFYASPRMLKNQFLSIP